jgi:UDP-N-acetylglucosamine transferase subunit ALG13
VTILGIARLSGVPRKASPVEVLVVCSSGGHLFDAVAISDAWITRTRAWVSFDKPDVRSLLADERVYIAHGPTNRNIPNFLRNLVAAWRVIAEARPRVLVTTGAGIGVPFAWIARLRGARIVYVESSGRVDKRSLSGRLVAPIAERVYAQWPDLAASWTRALYAGNVLQRPRPEISSPSRGSGVVVTVGTNEAPFDRLVAAVGSLVGEPVVVQHGASAVRPARARCFDYLPHDELDRLVGSARVVVCHAGIGSVALALAHGKRPVVVPRLRRFREAVDDHQLFFARKLEATGLVTVVEDVEQLSRVVAGHDHAATLEPGPDLTAAIRSALDELIGKPRARAGRGVAPCT